MPRKKQASFEENLQELENIVIRLEKGQSPLADIVADYTKGMELSAKCMDALKQAEKKMDIVEVKKDNTPILSQSSDDVVLIPINPSKLFSTVLFLL